MTMRQLRIEAEQLVHGPIEKEFDLTPSDFELVDEPDIKFPRNLTGRVRALRAGESILVTGELHTVADTACVRCLQDLTLPLDLRFQLAFVPEDPENPSNDPDEDAKSVYHGDFIYPMEAMREELMIALPGLPACPADDAEACNARRDAMAPSATPVEPSPEGFGAQLARARAKLNGDA